MIDFDALDDDEATDLVSLGYIQTCSHCCEPGFVAGANEVVNGREHYRAWNGWHVVDGLPFCTACHNKLFSEET